MNKLLICMAVACVTAVNAAAQSFSAATYNIRQLNAKDTAEGNGWEQRLPVISSLIRFHDFAIFGAQEVFHSQLQGMLAALPGYDYVGVGRDDGAAGGEYSAIFYKRGRFRLPFLALRRPLEARQGLGRQIRPHLHMGPVL